MSISNEEVALALLTTKNIKEASEKSGISERTIYRMKQSAEFEKIYDDLSDKLYSESIKKVQVMSIEALGVAQNILQNEDHNPNVRLQSAKMLLDIAHRIHEEKNYKERLDALEKTVNLNENRHWK